MTVDRRGATMVRVAICEAETRDEAQHVAREQFVEANAIYKGAAFEVEPMTAADQCPACGDALRECRVAEDCLHCTTCAWCGTEEDIRSAGDVFLQCCLFGKIIYC